MRRQQQSDDDPFAQLAEWSRGAERRVRRAHRIRLALRSVRRRRRGILRALTAVVLVGALVAGLIYTTNHPRGLGSPGAYATTAPPSGITATSGPSAAAAGAFAGTPAANFPAAETALIMPTAIAVGEWSAADVKADLDQVRRALIVTHLDPAMLIQHDVTAFTALVSPDTTKWVTRDFTAGELGITLIRIAPGAKLSTEKPRASGRTTYRVSQWGGVRALEVITNYVWVYAFDVPSGWAGARVVLIHGEEHWHFPKTSTVTQEYRGMSLGDVNGYWDLMDCAWANVGMTAPWTGHDEAPAPSSTSKDEPVSAYFQPDHTLDIPEGCDQSIKPSGY